MKLILRDYKIELTYMAKELNAVLGFIEYPLYKVQI